MQHGMFRYPRQDLIAGTVVFLVAVPLCLGIAVACGVPPISGLVAGIAGGLIAPWISRAPQSVTGPAAGLTSIVLVEVQHLGGLGPFLAAVIAAGVLQVVLGVLRTGRFASLVPSAVIKGMLAAIGITIILKQLPVAFGAGGGFASIGAQFTPGALVLAAISLAILFGWPKTPLAKVSWLSAPLVVVVVATVLALLFAGVPSLALLPTHLVQIPLGNPGELFAALPRPEIGALLKPATWVAGVTIAIVGSIETLLSLQAIDRLDPLKRRSAPDRELLAQGVTNAVSGFLGGLPVTAVIVRGGANVAAGGRERLSALTHGVLLLVALLFAGPLLNRIPLAALAAILIHVGLKLCAPALFRSQYRLGMNQFAPYVLTIVAILATDLLKGVIAGIVFGIFFVLRQNSRGAIVAAPDADGTNRVRFRRDGTFISKPVLVGMLETVKDGERVVIDGTGEFVDHDVKEVLAEFVERAHDRNIRVELVGIDLAGATPGGGH
ncbi:MAG: SulP family inorganic anion transporter [Gemmatimonadaceae bacterium]|nr:SulP family inorganic anion transporter [Gemmatimonadaceae bacterium]